MVSAPVKMASDFSIIVAVDFGTTYSGTSHFTFRYRTCGS